MHAIDTLTSSQSTGSTRLESLVDATTNFHPSGTCKMGPSDDPMAVVDGRLRLRGIGNLRVCDASVFPDMVTVNINHTVMMVAEKAAAMIVEDHPRSQAQN